MIKFWKKIIFEIFILIFTSILLFLTYFLQKKFFSDEIDDFIKNLTLTEKINLICWNSNDDALYELYKKFKNYTVIVPKITIDSKNFPDHRIISITDTNFLENYFKILELQTISSKNNCLLLNTKQLTFLKNLDSCLRERYIIFLIKFLKSLEDKIFLAIEQTENDLITLQINKYLYQNIKFDFTVNCENFSNHLKIAKLTKFSKVKEFVLSDYDVILCNHDSVFTAIMELSKQSPFYQNLINKKVKNILTKFPFEKVITKTQDIDLENIEKFTYYNLAKYSITVLKNNSLQLNKSYKILIINSKEFKNAQFFDKILKLNNFYTKIINLNINQINELVNTEKNTIKIFLLDSTCSEEIYKKLIKIDSLSHIIVINSGNTSLIKNQLLLKNSLFIWDNDTVTLYYLALGLLGSADLTGKICNQGVKLTKNIINYDYPEAQGISSNILSKIDTLAVWAIKNKVFPGCQILVIKNGFIVYNKAFGYIDYQKTARVTTNTLYDLASITKIVATTLAIMKLNELNKLNIQKTLNFYLKDTIIDFQKVKNLQYSPIVKKDTINVFKTKNWKKLAENKDTLRLNDSLVILIDSIKFQFSLQNNIFKIPIKNFLTHTSGLPVSIQINKYLNPELFSHYYSEKYEVGETEITVADGIYLKNEYVDSIWQEIKALPVSSYKKYLYSDANMVVLKILVDSITQEPFESFLETQIYKPLGITHLLFNPLKKFPKQQIAPTETDKYWRKQTIWGYVHDPTAALLGGVSGNAGLFGNAYSLGVIGQMLLNKGQYNGVQIFKPQTIDFFTQRQTEYRALGFDLWNEKQIAAKIASARTFGHTGFTGNCLWIDPDNNLIFVFLSNRVHPDANNNLLNKYKIRQQIHNLAYESIFWFF